MGLNLRSGLQTATGVRPGELHRATASGTSFRTLQEASGFPRSSTRPAGERSPVPMESALCCAGAPVPSVQALEDVGAGYRQPPPLYEKAVCWKFFKPEINSNPD